METIKINPKTQKNTAIINNKFSNQPVGKQSQIRQKTLIHGKIYEETIQKMAGTIQDVDEEIHFKHTKIDFLADKIEISDQQLENVNRVEFFDSKN